MKPLNSSNYREDIVGLPALMALLRETLAVSHLRRSFLDAAYSYKSLKAALEGGMRDAAKCFILCHLEPPSYASAK